MVEHPADGTHRGGDRRNSGRILDALHGGQRRHLHASGRDDYVGAGGIQAFDVVQQLQRIAPADFEVVGNLETDRIDDLDALVLEVLDDKVGQWLHVRSHQRDAAGAQRLQPVHQRTSRRHDRC